MRISSRRMNGMLHLMGQAVRWQKAYLCPCRNPLSGAPLPGCPQCGSKGVLWAAAVDAWTGVASMHVARAWASFGQWEDGDVVFTVPSDSPFYAAGEGDRVVMAQSSEPFQSILTHDGSDKLSPAVISVDRLFWLTPDKQDTVEGDAPTVAADGSLSWLEGTTPPPSDTQYSVTGRRRPEYYMFRELPQDRAHFGGSPLPRRIHMRRFDLFGR